MLHNIYQISTLTKFKIQNTTKNSGDNKIQQASLQKRKFVLYRPSKYCSIDQANTVVTFYKKIQNEENSSNRIAGRNYGVRYLVCV